MGKINAAAGIVLLLATGTLIACSNQDAPARATADQLAAGIAAMDLAQVPLAGSDAT
ncbi:MAG: hypothetical protein JWO93_2401, partial [Micrococcaceae bacterium]|nr:hypothetical protein [Micrococcaceae bacterium]